MNRRVVWLSVVSMLVVGGLVVACSDDAECEAKEDCLEVKCPDGSTIQGCQDGVCLQGSDCPNTGGW